MKSITCLWKRISKVRVEVGTNEDLRKSSMSLNPWKYRDSNRLRGANGLNNYNTRHRKKKKRMNAWHWPFWHCASKRRNENKIALYITGHHVIVSAHCVTNCAAVKPPNLSIPLISTQHRARQLEVSHFSIDKWVLISGLCSAHIPKKHGLSNQQKAKVRRWWCFPCRTQRILYPRVSRGGVLWLRCPCNTRAYWGMHLLFIIGTLLDLSIQ